MVKTSIAAVSEIVNNIVQQKQAGNLDVSAIANREIDKYFEKEQNANEGEALISHPKEGGEGHSFILDGIHGEGTDVEEGERAPYQDDKYGEQPPMSLRGEQTGVTTQVDPHTSKQRKNAEPESTPPPKRTSLGSSYSTGSECHENDESYDNVAMELGMTPESHPQFFQKKRYKLPVRILNNKYCQYCMIISGFVLLSLSVAALVTRGFDELKKHHAQTQAVGSSSGSKEKMDWWLDNGGNGITQKQFETLTYLLEDSFLPIWFDRKSGWKGQTYQEAVEFCEEHDNFMPCPYDGTPKNGFVSYIVSRIHLNNVPLTITLYHSVLSSKNR